MKIRRSILTILSFNILLGASLAFGIEAWSEWIEGRIMASVPSEGLDQATVGEVLLPLRGVGTAVVVMLVLMNGCLMISVSRRYEQKVANVNTEMEALVKERTDAMLKTRDAVIFGLAKLAESRDTDTGEHLDRIQEYVTILARKLASRHPCINDHYISKLQLASSLHDIGKVGIPDDILLKPGRLSSSEREIMERHATIGKECLMAIRKRLGDVDFLDMACEIASSHHEYWNGEGYPAGLRGREIPLSARIVSVADVYDALTSRRVYKAKMSHDKARSIIKEGNGTQFDPDVVNAFLQCAQQFKNVADNTPDTCVDHEPEMRLLQQLKLMGVDAMVAPKDEEPQGPPAEGLRDAPRTTNA